MMKNKFRPFHETILNAIRQATVAGIHALAPLVIETIIPENHDEILSAWKERCQELGIESSAYLITETLLEQKKIAGQRFAPRQGPEKDQRLGDPLTEEVLKEKGIELPHGYSITWYRDMYLLYDGNYRIDFIHELEQEKIDGVIAEFNAAP